ncbi:hypothetical protein I6F14_10550 [Bradyrhizobium sp. IC3069]|uniref:hypothetical protein n=1 Tax=unclassified Bradyrhizobium TaxID=2631580 RepID=UPI001CD3C310|nr:MULTISPECIES: hypothetical protein [unclassified Bradyrhizobium]MCA1360778.1 hypothetical protein [Bradyrhizobium sp. IC4059]MCA1518423.1 hypothetical protein [Bradyrhizobium sp. IC3069]
MAHVASPENMSTQPLSPPPSLNEVQKMVSREMTVEDGAVVTIGTIHGGAGTNIICLSVDMELTITTASSQRRRLLSREYVNWSKAWLRCTTPNALGAV